ncbi:DUF2493 domain-containing protein [uncultured Roseibium sp.]|uniref:DUF2493 domain-containing protein n=1 Tax=uncultured Roseibium sp. TaxID=1936171 RepID=UPI00262F2CFA|nr:DUF2493 domain-containing protein [uncultured Roseibium sp.]
MLNVIVTGGRDFEDGIFVAQTLSKFHTGRNGPITRLVEGGATGADAFAREWALANGVEHKAVAADWGKFGKGAGPIRNREMAVAYPDSIVIAFPGGDGTADMIQVGLDHAMTVHQFGEPARVQANLFGGEVVSV